LRAGSSQLGVLRQIIRPHGWVIPLLVMLNLLASLAECVGIGLLIPLLGSMQPAAQVASGSGFAAVLDHVGGWVGPRNSFVVLGLGILGLVILKTGVLILQTAIATRIIARVTADLRLRLCRKLLWMDYGEYLRMREGHVMNVLDVQTQRTSDALMDAVTVIGSLCFLMVFGVSLLALSWQMALLVAVAAVPPVLLVRTMSRRAQRRGERLMHAGGALSARALELLSAMRTIRILGQERAEEQRFERAAQEVRAAFVDAEFRKWSVQSLAELIYLPVFLVVVGYGWYSGMSVPQLVVFLILLYRMQPHAGRLDFARVSLANNRAGVAEVAAMVGVGEERPEQTSGSVQFERLRDAVEFDRVSFSYGRTLGPVIGEVSFRIARGQMVAIVGRSGAGKSTLVNLLLRLFEPSAGTVRVDGVPIAEYDLGSIRRRIAFAGQDADLLIGSIRDNIAFGAPGASMESIRKAATLAMADGFIAELPQGYDTAVGPRGIALSGGQRQRIALARALVREPEILILDEATSAVDPATESAIQQAVERLRDRCTIVVIAHRPSTVRGADLVLVMDAGRLVARGSPQSLLSQGHLSGALDG
jgi:ATP-binding cassette, subfamily B, bacterial MsbA